MKRVRRFGFGPLCAFILLALLGFVFFITSLVMIWINSDDVNKFLNDKFKSNLNSLKLFIILSVLNTVGLFITFIHLVIAKPTSRKVIFPIVFFSITTFVILISLDFYLEIQLSHLPPPPKISYTMEKPNKKGKSRVKMGFLAIYVCLCIVSGLIYLAYKELEDFLENQQKEQEKENEIIITISHIT